MMDTDINASREEKVSSMQRDLPASACSSHLRTSPVERCKKLEGHRDEIEAAVSHRSCSETSQEWFGESLRRNVRETTKLVEVEGIGTLFSDVLYFDGVGFAIKPEDWIVWRHCGGFTMHRERERRDGKAREGEREEVRGRRAGYVSTWR
jgi:hypothetical protein